MAIDDWTCLDLDRWERGTGYCPSERKNGKSGLGADRHAEYWLQ